jgi:hypothetical protein
MNENIYAAPKSDIEQPDKERKRPVLVWIIFILACFGLLGIVSHFVMVSGNIPMDKATARYYANMGVLDHILVIFGTLYGFVAGLQLFRLKRSAFYLYLGQIPVFSLMFLYSYSNPDYRELMASMGSNMYFSLVPGIVFSILYIVYAYYLLRKGTLK